MAVNLVKIRTDAGTRDFFRSVQRQLDQYQGIWIVSPEGKVLGGGPDHKDKPGSVEKLDAALKAFGPVKPRAAKPGEQLPHRGVGVKPDGNVDLAIYRRALHQRKSDGPCLRDTLTLARTEWAALAPPRLDSGTEWEVPEAVARKLVRPLVYNTLGSPESMPGPDDAKQAQLTAKVDAVEDGQVRIRLSGSFEAIKVLRDEPQFSYRGAATATGIAIYDSKRKTMSSLLIVFEGTYQQGSPPDAQRGRALGAVIEWQRERVPQR